MNSKLSMCAWGDPDDWRTFSGLARAIASALRAHGHLGNLYSIKDVRNTDLLRGAATVSQLLPFPKMMISRPWIFSEQGRSLLQPRLVRKLRDGSDTSPLLEIGTMLRGGEDLPNLFQLTDMTIPQSLRAGFFLHRVHRRHWRAMEEHQCRLLGSARHVFALTQWTARSIIDDCGVPEDRVSVTYAGSNLPQRRPRVRQRRRFNILFVGIDWARKGGPLLIEAFARVRRELPTATLTIVGCQPEIPAGLREGVEVLGLLRRSDPAQLARLQDAFEMAECFCLPSLFDPFPNVIIEGFASGLPCVSFDSGSRSEAVTRGETGELVPLGDMEKLAEALIHVLRSEDRLRAMSANCERQAAEVFSWGAVVRRIMTQVERSTVPVRPASP